MYIFPVLNIIIVSSIFTESYLQFDDICGITNGKRLYLEHGETGSLLANFRNNVSIRRNMTSYNRCSVEFITCPSCIIEIKFRYLNISRICGKSSVYDTCGCDYVWIYEPPVEDASGEQFCGRFIENNISELSYVSQTRTVAISFIFNKDYGHAFTLDYSTKRNTIIIHGYPRIGNMNNSSQIISSPFFPYSYPTDLSLEYIISCESKETCRINLLFTDFLLEDSSIIEFFDWNGQRMQVISGNTFRPPVITSNGPSMTIRFYANGASDFGFKATYSFILGTLDDLVFKPIIGCGGNVNNLGGGITMMNMLESGTKLFDCVWIIKPPESLLHRKTHLYVKVATFSSFDPKDHREFSKVPNFLFPKEDTFSDITTATFIFLTCSFGLIGIILAMALLLYRVNVKAQNQRQIQDHIETIHAILEEGVRDIEEEIIVPDEPPDYEPPPDYNELLKLNQLKCHKNLEHSHKRCLANNLAKTNTVSISPDLSTGQTPDGSFQPTHFNNRNHQPTSSIIPHSPPPAYTCVKQTSSEQNQLFDVSNSVQLVENLGPGTSSISNGYFPKLPDTSFRAIVEERARNPSGCFPVCNPQFLQDIRKSFRNCKSVTILKYTIQMKSCSEENLVRYFSDSELIFNNNVNDWCTVDRSGLKKSYSTDDLSLL
ncbi:CUB and LDLa domain isoform X4 [Leptinotarsa decemlineata]|uniref:CUB and LDLa domain isoform X4 n=1 Tax=Leptinotarsa decemlineata TaxID=7539 RepID=UPI003D3069D9